MNSGTLAGSLIFAAVLVMLIAVLARLMMRG
ncbi:transporter, partial [Mycobacterium tuberculosis]|nr:transporter [Mycobacterium tuberculosis]